MKINRKLRKKLKRIFKPYYIMVAILIIAMGVFAYLFFFNPTRFVETEGVKIVVTDVKEGQEISENDAKRTAVKQFEQLGEKVKESDIKCEKIQRKGQLYYYLTSVNNTMEIQITGGKVTRVNSVPVEYQK